MGIRRFLGLAAWVWVGLGHGRASAQEYFPLEAGDLRVYLLEEDGVATGFKQRQCVMSFDTGRGWTQALVEDEGGTKQTLLRNKDGFSTWRNHRLSTGKVQTLREWSFDPFTQWTLTSEDGCVTKDRFVGVFPLDGPFLSVLDQIFTTVMYHATDVKNACTGQAYKQFDMSQRKLGPVYREARKEGVLYTESLMFADLKSGQTNAGGRDKAKDDRTLASLTMVLVRDTGQEDRPVPMMLSVRNESAAMLQLGPDATIQMRWVAKSGEVDSWEYSVAGKKVRANRSLVVTDMVDAPDQKIYWPQHNGEGDLSATLIDEPLGLKVQTQLPLTWYPSDIGLRCGMKVCRRDQEHCQLGFDETDVSAVTKGLGLCLPILPGCGPGTACIDCLDLTLGYVRREQLLPGGAVECKGSYEEGFIVSLRR